MVMFAIDFNLDPRDDRERMFAPMWQMIRTTRGKTPRVANFRYST